MDLGSREQERRTALAAKKKSSKKVKSLPAKTPSSRKARAVKGGIEGPSTRKKW